MKILKREFVAPMFMASIGVFFLGFIWIMNLYLKEGDHLPFVHYLCLGIGIAIEVAVCAINFRKYGIKKGAFISLIYIFVCAPIVSLFMYFIILLLVLSLKM